MSPLITYDQVKDNLKVLRAMTSLDPSEFETLLADFEKTWEADCHAHQLPDADREREVGGGRKAVLQTGADKLLFILFYFKIYPLQEILGFLFGMSQGTACIWVHRLSAVWKQTHASRKELPQRNPTKLRGDLRKQGEQKLCIDGTERKIQRPKDPTDQKTFYSGKRHAHTVKNDLVVSIKNREVKYLSQTYEGKKSDKKIADEERCGFPRGSTLYQDKGFEGYAPVGVKVKQPKKKPKGKELSDQDKARNRKISKVRVVVEHVLAGVKRCRIVKDVFRNTKAHFDDLVMEISCGLHNFRTRLRSGSKRKRAIPYFQ
jgi:hypothetical protein